MFSNHSVVVAPPFNHQTLLPKAPVSTPRHPLLTPPPPLRFSVCGRIAVSRLPEGMKQQSRYRVTLTTRDQDLSTTADSDPQGGFCFQAKPGDYSVHVRPPLAVVSPPLAVVSPPLAAR